MTDEKICPFISIAGKIMVPCWRENCMAWVSGGEVQRIYPASLGSVKVTGYTRSYCRLIERGA